MKIQLSGKAKIQVVHNQREKLKLMLTAKISKRRTT